MSDLRKTPLFELHEQAGGKMVDFGGWALPVNYGSQMDEHHAVRTDCGMFDVSHMTVSDVTGAETLNFLEYLLANDINKTSDLDGKALYSCMLNEDGGVIDDLIVYRISDQHCRIVTNASTNEKDMAWMAKQANAFDVSFKERPELALIAVQGPNAIQKGSLALAKLNTEFAATMSDLERFQGVFHEDEFVGRTGYTGEDGVEFIISESLATKLWQNLSDAGVPACGLGARDTLRLESGMSLYGNDLDEHHTPIESGIGWSVALKDDRKFIGKSALLESAESKLIGLILQDRGVLRSHQTVIVGDSEVGEITSGTFSPTLQQSIALARVSQNCDLKIGDKVEIAVRNKRLAAVVAKSPFVKNGKATNES